MRFIPVGILLLLGSCLGAAAPAGLSVGPAGELLRAGRPYQGLGVNYYDAFVRTLTAVSRTNYDAGFTELQARRIPFARFSAGGYWPNDWQLYRTNRAEYFARLDAVVQSAERHGLGLIPSLFWQLSTVPDLVGDPCRRWGDTNSATHAFMRNYTREVVTRYVSSPAIWAWEFGNEYNLAADLPNASDHRPPIVPSLGTPTGRSVADELTHADIRCAVRAFAAEVRRLDPHRLIISGHAFPRLSAWHQEHDHNWTHDTPEQFTQVLANDNPSPVDSISVRAYEAATDVARLAAAMTVARREKKPLFVGEFGIPGPDRPASRQQFTALLEALETNHVPLAALWVFDFNDQAADWSVTAANERHWQLDALQKANDQRANAGR